MVAHIPCVGAVPPRCVGLREPNQLMPFQSKPLNLAVVALAVWSSQTMNISPYRLKVRQLTIYKIVVLLAAAAFLVLIQTGK